jgi:outer membrane protease
VGAGYRHLDYAWEAGDGVQSYPSDPSAPDDALEGLGIAYDLEVRMPCVEIGARWAGGPWNVELRGGFSPFVQAEDRDDHVAREILSTTDADGTGGFADLAVRYTFAERWSVEARGTVLGFSVEGPSKNLVYGSADPEMVPGEEWTIDEEIESTQYGASMGIACRL